MLAGCPLLYHQNELRAVKLCGWVPYLGIAYFHEHHIHMLLSEIHEHSTQWQMFDFRNADTLWGALNRI